jgi:hypothetical protein
MRCTGHVACIGNMRNAYKLVGKCKRKRPLRRSKQRCVDNTIMDLMEIVCGLDASGSG